MGQCRCIVAFSAVVVLVSLSLAGCTDEKTIDIVINNSQCVPIVQRSESETFSAVVVVDLSAEVDAALGRAGYSRSDVKAAVLNGMTYQVTEFSHVHDWTITGDIRVQRLDVSGPEAVLLKYTEVSLLGAKPAPQVASLESGGVEIVNSALSDFAGGLDPVLRIVVENAAVTEEVSADDPIVFSWEACLEYQVVVEETVDILDPL